MLLGCRRHVVLDFKILINLAFIMMIVHKLTQTAYLHWIVLVMQAEGKRVIEPLCIGTVRGVVQGVEVGQEGVAGGGVGRRHWGRVR